MSHWITLSEVRLALRLIAKQPILSITVVLALATGICLATIGFTLRDAMLNGHLPFANGDRFVRLAVYSESDAGAEFDLEHYHAIRDTSKSFVHVGAAGGSELGLEAGDGILEPIRCGLLTPRSFRFLPAVPLQGRLFVEADGETGAEPVVILRESLWRRRFGGEPTIVGKPIQLGGVRRTVVGVLPDAFKFPSAGEIWIPLDEATVGGRSGRLGATVRSFAILREGLSVAGATGELAAYSRAELPGKPGTALSVRAVPFTGDSGSAAIVMSGLVAVLVLVLVVVASNIATLVFARTWSRSSELAVRTALGAARSRVVGQLFVEVLMLGALASVLGLGLAEVSLSYMVRMMSEIGWWVSFDPNARTVAFVIALALLVSVISGLVPALKVTRRTLTQTLHVHGRGAAAGGFGRIGGAMLVVQIAFAVALLNGSIVIARAFSSFVDDVAALPKGQVVTMQISGDQSRDVRDRMLGAMRLLPGVVSAGAAMHLPRLDPQPTRFAIEPIEGETLTSTEPAPSTQVSDGFLESVGGRALSGRLFTASDFAKGAAPVAIVNEQFSTKYLGGRLPLGRRLRLSEGEVWREIVGVVPDLGMSVGDRSRAAGFYLPMSDTTSWLYIAVRSSSNPMALTSPIRKAVAAIDPAIDIRNLIPLERVGWEERSFLSGIATAMTALGVMALLLSVVSIYALLSFMVTRRTREIGIRVALGAVRSQVLATIAGNAAVLLLTGSVVGSALGLALISLRSLILIRMPDPGFMTPAIVIGVLALASLTAAWVPTRRALNIRPSEALATE